MNKKLNKNLVIITRCVLFCLGAVLGALAMWQFLRAYPDKVRDSLKIVFYITSGLLLGLVLLLSAKPILSLTEAVGRGLKKIFGRAQPMEIAGVMLGFIIGIMIAYLCEALLGLVLKIISLRIVIDVIVGLAATYVACLLCTKSLKAGQKEEEQDAPLCEGFILSAGALSSDRCVRLVTDWLEGGVYVLSKTVNSLIGEMENGYSAAALKNYRKLIDGGYIKLVNSEGGLDEAEEIIKFAEARRLKIVCLAPDELKSRESSVPVLCLDEL